MYNVYIEEKKKKIQKDKLLIEEKENKLREHRQRILPELINNYQSRVENFVLDMAHAPIVVKVNKDYIKNPRHEYLEESKGKILGRKGIILKGYVTEKERIERRMKEMEKYNNRSLNRDSSFNSNNSLPYESKSTIVQQEMRFKPRTDIERIFEEINKNSSRKLDKKILDNQMREIQSRKSVKSNESLSRIKDRNKEKEENIILDKDNLDKEMSFFMENHNEIDEYLNQLRLKKEEEKKKQNNKDRFRKLNNYKTELNQEAKNILNEFHHKTHFKAVSTIANYYKDRVPEKTQKMKISRNPNLELKEINFDHNVIEENESALNRNQSRFTLNLNPRVSDASSRQRTDNHYLEYLKEISKSVTLVNKNQEEDGEKVSTGKKFFTNGKSRSIRRSKVTFRDILVEPEEKKEKVLSIDNQSYSIGNQINVIASKILNKCNLRSEKSENNRNRLKSGEGKLMFTNGLSVKEFERKIGLRSNKNSKSNEKL